MIFDLEVNDRIIQARKGETILNTLRNNGIHVPTLCSMSGFSPTGACRICVVEVEGQDKLIPSCSYPVEEWMKIKTHSPRVLKARKTIVELLLSNHPDDCLYCERSGNCELQRLAEDLNIRERRIPGKKSTYKIDKSSQSIIKDPSKCILCGRCVRVCEEYQAVSTFDFTYRGSELIISTALNKPLNFSNCINCGQCVMVCPTGSLTEKVQFGEIENILHEPSKHLIAQYSPVVAISLGELFGVKSGKEMNGIINSALRKIGFEKVFDSSFYADLNIMEMAEDFVRRLTEGKTLPIITGCCPAWIKFAEQNAPDFLPSLTTVKSPQQIGGALIKSWITERYGLESGSIHSVSIMPCTAEKYESQRVEMTQKGVSDIDTVLTTRELARLIRLHGIDLDHLEPQPYDEPMGSMSSAGKLFGVSGGTLEALLRTVYFRLTGKELEKNQLQKLRGNKPVREIQLSVDNKELNCVAVSGIANALKVLEDIRAGRKQYHIIEIMACQGGCVAGGGQPIPADERDIKSRIKSLYDCDDRELINAAHKNPQVINAYDQFLGEPMSEKSKNLLHTSFSI